ncbi:hypothetical protein N7522_011850 [Penicillium canescens]|uniref:Uncharacterized protein n=1 Tax=Penicillium canescens TaxID=5083 RepID=A0AAD6I9T5_PENCN|nr:uncharacterized protein N7446_012094 [Penicillium canescens]KAJ5991643.1 hypothetical protein N7522_011850 [Penicillium canescens]KAJ6038621.1 hypothetical protein N7460_007338 [Penicillium canescens]KAJ6047260.1 hypothetical protein N7446_012094 [Penicillium canescens]KAJ6060016.1 hypothetical protein N7444_002948 [Penicillium canescens]
METLNPQMFIGNHHQSIPIPETLHSLPGGHVAVLAGDELPPPRGARWELSEQQFGCLRVPGGAQQRDLPPFHDTLTRRKPSLRTSRNTQHHRTSTKEEVVPPHTYAPTTENGLCHSIYPARQLFTVPDLEDYAMRKRSGRPDMINTTQSEQSQEPRPKNDEHTLL